MVDSGVRGPEDIHKMKNGTRSVGPKAVMAGTEMVVIISEKDVPIVVQVMRNKRIVGTVVMMANPVTMEVDIVRMTAAITDEMNVDRATVDTVMMAIKTGKKTVITTKMIGTHVAMIHIGTIAHIKITILLVGEMIEITMVTTLMIDVTGARTETMTDEITDCDGNL